VCRRAGASASGGAYPAFRQVLGRRVRHGPGGQACARAPLALGAADASGVRLARVGVVSGWSDDSDPPELAAKIHDLNH
jgi:hypothetical protein